MKTCMFSGLFRNRSIDEAFSLGSKMGYEAIEIRCKLHHIDENTSKNDLKHIFDFSRKHTMPITSLNASLFGNLSKSYSTDIFKQLNKN